MSEVLLSNKKDESVGLWDVDSVGSQVLKSNLALLQVHQGRAGGILSLDSSIDLLLLGSNLSFDISSEVSNLLLLSLVLGLLLHGNLDVVAGSSCLGAAESGWRIEHGGHRDILVVNHATGSSTEVHFRYYKV